MKAKVSFAASEKMLARAFSQLFSFALAVPAARKNVEVAYTFSYLLTPKQVDEINRVCLAQGWPQVTVRGIEITVAAIHHVCDSRSTKDALTNEQILEIITKAYSPRSTIRTNRNHDQQSLIFNTHQKLKVGEGMYHGLAVLQLLNAGPITYLAPVTCYHATEAKIRAINK
ncbi:MULTISPECIES: hypothetical protein [Xanthomonas]|uniref:hypothetical protein n=1 Tax=Xanthomonas TaxID=338 RepID=UPI00118751EF|nr:MULTISPECIES: hypothetical protein [Xanthomonas]MCC8612801.1 hypothetical protein [Xanthomonas euvesicatoria pv. euvesicatoria]CAD7740297.1 hypothetical protein LMG31884_46490 [Xanthomonas hydrangeae]CAD7740301.1 hypothetical protein LMG31884_46490 [Xanthomonas hydrangeae]